MTRPLHLLEVGLMWPPEPFIQRKLERLAASGVRVTVATRVDRRRAAGVQLQGVELRRLPRTDRRRRRLLPRAVFDGVALATSDPGLLGRLLRTVFRRRLFGSLHLLLPVARLRADIVHFEWNGWAVDHLPLIEAWRRPVVISCRGSAINVRPLMPAYEHLKRGLPETFQWAAAVHCVSDAMLTQAERYGLDRTKARVIRPAVDLAFFAPRLREPPTTDAFRVAAVGMLRWQKGYEYALVAIRELVERGVPVAFELLGDEPPAGLDEVSDLPRLRYAIEDLGIAEHVQLLGPAPPEGVRDLLYRAHAFLHPSVAEGLPNVVLEAMACRLPVVVTDAGGTREAVQDSVEGFVVPPRDAHALADALDRLWRDESLRTRLGRAARARVEADFSLDDQTEAFEALYRELVGSQRRGAPRAPETVTDSAVS